jgi:thiamine pyrophosphokinase
MSRFAILLGGGLVRTPRLDAQVAGVRVIAADSGIRHASALDVAPELWVGDFDSVPPVLPAHYSDIPRKTFPSAKDQTDGELAIAEALGLGATSLVLCGAFGGQRADHEFLHLALAVQLAEAGIEVTLTSGVQEGFPLLPGAVEFDYEDGTLFSILGFSELVGLSVEGAKWPLDCVEVAFGSSLTISNETRGRLRISLEHGRAVLLAHPYPLPEH